MCPAPTLSFHRQVLRFVCTWHLCLDQRHRHGHSFTLYGVANANEIAENGHSLCQCLRCYWHNVKLWRLRKYRRQVWTGLYTTIYILVRSEPSSCRVHSVPLFGSDPLEQKWRRRRNQTDLFSIETSNTEWDTLLAVTMGPFVPQCLLSLIHSNVIVKERLHLLMTLRKTTDVHSCLFVYVCVSVCS